ncbi:MAG: AAA family ATPase [Oscillospiraceae bacterium]|jgi:DNA polymerase-3 subunit delta'|nr:AAA family ATPase [Oscillospiraceae bacterium]
MKLSDFVGNENIKEQVAAIIDKNRFPHAILLQGEEGIGKRTIAFMIAKAAVCSSLGKKPCNSCIDCLKADAKTHPDIAYPKATGGTKSFRVDAIREIRENAYILPNEAKFKIYIFESVDKMTEQAQNAFLKLLEEPPKHVIFILTCNSFDSLLFTVRSRCQIFSIKPVSDIKAIAFLSLYYPEFSEEEIEKTVKLSHGNIGRAITILKNSLDNKTYAVARDIGTALLDDTEWELLAAIGKASKDRNLFILSLDYLELIFRDACILCYSKNKYFPEGDAAKNLSRRFGSNALVKFIRILQKTKKYLDRNVGINFLAMYLCANLRKIAFKEN